MINHRGGILIFGQILSKLKILDFRVKDFKFCDFVKFLDFRVKVLKFAIFVKIFIKFVQNSSKTRIFVVKIQILWSRVNDLKFRFSLGLIRISNFTKSPKSKFYKNHQILSKKNLNITNFVGSRFPCAARDVAHLRPFAARWVLPPVGRFPARPDFAKLRGEKKSKNRSRQTSGRHEQ